ncbi:hypothetical protein [Plantactinospora sp. CA-290183]|uniref:hypothetical protein n=1 Tax=Plantactinospora sp. CA-290183 TaxID=3240006 RepID=UPI003D91A792
MAQDAEPGCADGEPDSLLGDHALRHPPAGPPGRLRWVCGTAAGSDRVAGGSERGVAGPDGTAAGTGRVPAGPEAEAEPGRAPSGGADGPHRAESRAAGTERAAGVPRPRTGEQGADAPEQATAAAGAADRPATAAQQDAAETPAGSQSRPSSGCRTDRPGWAGAHRHGAVRPTRRVVRRDRPPRRWC